MVTISKVVYYVEESTGPASPTFSPSGGQVAYGTQVTLTQNEADMIMYTTDGSAPSYANENGEVYTTPIAITADMTIRAIAIDADENESEVATAVYTLIRPAAPTFSPNGGQVAYGTTVTVSAPTGCTILYTTDGTDPYESSTATLTDGNTATVTINADMTIRAISIDGNALESSEASTTYTILHPNAPTFSPNGGQVAEGTTVTITAPTGCTILYTTDGTDPYESGSAVDVNSNTASVTITESITLKAIALDANLIPSTVAEATFTVAEIGAVKYVLVTDASTLQDGDEVIIVGKKGNSSAAMSTTQNNNNRPEIDVTSAVQRDGSIIAPPTVATITLGATTVGNNTAAWTLYVNNGASTGYLYAASSSSNQLKTKDEVDNNARATISIDESNGEATVQFKGTYTRNQLKYNSTSQLFSCYASGQQPISIYRKTVIPSPKVEVSSLGYGTMYYGDRNLIVPEGVRAHALTTNGNQLVITKTYAANDVIPAGTAVMLVETTQPYSKQQLRFVSTHTTGTAPADNYLQGTDEEEIIDDAGYKYYMLTTKSGVLGFYWQQGSNEGTAIMNAAHKAYLRVPTGAGIKGFTFDNLVTGITAINGNGNTNGNDGWYTLDGRRLSGPPTQQGIYIHNGRKEVVK
ncbi:MAG: chitobiase/beta-hexosaminidase C-terminal domain-containing protein [Bacteroidaceae bacterium]|nr:chitobiase/beta-hexosaminidase C-terminal domain-containing protein [Bacteroidaceae bacterium]